MLIRSILLLFAWQIAFLQIVAKPANSVDFKLINLAGRPLEVFWIDTFSASESLVPQSKKPIRNNTDILIHSYANHKFSVRLLKHIAHSEANFTKLAKDEVIRVTFDKEKQMLVIDQQTKYNEGMTLLRQAVSDCETNSRKQGDDAIHDCIEGKVLEYAKEFTESHNTMDRYRENLSERLRNYTCLDPAMNSTEPIREYDYYFLENVYNIQVYLDNGNAKIWSVEDFVTEDECKFLEEFARPNLARATVAGEDGQSIISQHRKAQQAAYDLKEDIKSDKLWPLYSRILHLVNYHGKLNVQPEGQEGFTIIQYSVGDEYMPHCDGSCDGNPYRKYGRVATAVLYCTTPTLGGATTFTNADVFIRGKPGQAVFFSYKDPVTNVMDEKLTEHSGCPILEGEKWIATAWLREGVSADEPSSKFDPDGVPVYSEGGEEDEYSDFEEDIGHDEL